MHIRILDIKVNQLRGNSIEHDITKHLFTTYFSWRKINKIYKEETISLGLPTTPYPPQTNYPLILYLGHGNHDKKMHYPCIHYIYFSTT